MTKVIFDQVLIQKIEAAKTQFGTEYDEARADALSVGFNEAEADEIASDWVDVKACYSVLTITLPDS